MHNTHRRSPKTHPQASTAGRLFLAALLVLAIPAATLPALEGATNLAEEALLADDPSSARAAFDTQAAESAHRPHLRTILVRLETRLAARAAQQRENIANAVKTTLTADTLSPLAAAAHDRQVAAQPMLRFAFDDRRYPVPAKAHTGWIPGVDVQPGQEDLEKLYADCFTAYDQLQTLQHARLMALLAALQPGAEKAFADNPQPPLPPYLQAVEKMRTAVTQPALAAGRLPENHPLTMYTLRAPDRTAERLLQLLHDRAATLRAIAAKLDDLRDWRAELEETIAADNQASHLPTTGTVVPGAQSRDTGRQQDRRAVALAAGRTDLPIDDARPNENPFAGLPPMALALIALADERFDRAADQAAAASPAGFSAFWAGLCDQAALLHNAAAPDLREHERWQLREINLYRYSLGLRPCIHNDRLQTAAQKHGERMHDKQFFGHFDPEADRRTPQLRARLEGYEGGTGENIAGGQDGWRCLWRWRSDAGHHRVLIHPYFCEAGFSEVSDNETLDTGTKPMDSLQILFEKRVSLAETPPEAPAVHPQLTILP